MNKLIRLAVSGGLIVLMLLGCYLMVGALRGFRLLSIQSSSMSPTLHKGDLVIIKRVQSSDLKLGDVITFINPANARQTITHRLVEMPTPFSLITKGDANSSTDRQVSTSSLVGKQVVHLAYAGHFFNILRRPLGLALLIYLPAIIIIADETRRLAHYYRQPPPATTSQPMVVTYLAITIITLIGLGGHKALAQLNAHAKLVGTTIATTAKPTNSCQSGQTFNFSSSGSASISITNTSSQSASSGSVTATGNGTTGNISSGPASNCASTNINLQITN